MVNAAAPQLTDAERLVVLRYQRDQLLEQIKRTNGYDEAHALFVKWWALRKESQAIEERQ